MSAAPLVCEGCGLAIPDGEDGRTWIQTALGLRAAVTHRDHGCAALAVEAQAEQPAQRVARPVTREERAPV